MLAVVIDGWALLLVCRRSSQHEIAQRASGLLSSEVHLADSRRVRAVIHVGMDEVHSPSDLVRSPYPTEILGKLVDGRVRDRRHCRPAEHAELITNVDIRDLGYRR